MVAEAGRYSAPSNAVRKIFGEGAYLERPLRAASRDDLPKSGAQRSSRIAVSSAPSCPLWLASTDWISER
jgi:hypothetical protein